MNCFIRKLLMKEYLIALKEANKINTERCYFNDECDVCNNPKLGSFAIGGAYDEVDSYICGKCILKGRKKKRTTKKRIEDTVIEKGLLDE